MSEQPTQQLEESFRGEALLQQYINECSNWGRWGPDDQQGALNLVGPEQVRRASGLVRQGKVIALTLPYDENGCQTGTLRSNPQRLMTATGTDYLNGNQDPLPGAWGAAHGWGFSDDVLVMPTQAGTQWDALCHIFFNGQMWNGRSADMVSSKGAEECGIESYTGKIAMRGVLLDIARLKGVAALEPGYAITTDDLREAAEAEGVQILPGDALLVRTGLMGARRGDWGDYAGGPAPGMSLHTAPWLHEHDVAAIVTDTWGVEVRPNEIDLFQPLHIVALVHMGMAFGEIFDLEALAEDCAADGVYEFFFVAPPLPITGASGSPVAAMAIK